MTRGEQNGKEIRFIQISIDLVKEYPEVTDIMKELGFSEITNKVMLNSVGKIMTIPKGAKMKGVSMIDIVGAFMKAGFTLEGDMPNLSG